jgi:Protein of unknown function (DUF3810)
VLTGVLVLCAALSLLPLPSSLVESVYARTVYPHVAAVVIPITSLSPFSLSFAFLLAAPVLVVAGIVLLRRHARGWLSWRTAAKVALTLVAMYGAFLLLWGFNYRREPIETLLEFPTTPVTPDDLERTANGLLEIVRANANAPRDTDAASSALRDSLRITVAGITGRTPTLPPRVKSPFTGWLLAWNVSGVVSPFTLEAHVDAALPEPFFLAVSAHELAHLTGFAGEADTDLVGAIAGLRAANPYARYAAALNAYASVRVELSAATRASTDARLPAQARADFGDYRAVLIRHRLPDFAVNATRSIYDGYLQSQGVASGIRDYSRVVTLLAKWWRTSNFKP